MEIHSGESTSLRRFVGSCGQGLQETPFSCCGRSQTYLLTVLTQIEACLNSRPLTALPYGKDSGIELRHFLIGRPLEALPDPAESYQPLPLLKRWHLCQALICHFWNRWSFKYLPALQKMTKWHTPSAPRKVSVGDIVGIRGDETIPGRWPLARVIQTHSGKDGAIRVVTVKTGRGNVYTRPIVKNRHTSTLKTAGLGRRYVELSTLDSVFYIYITSHLFIVLYGHANSM